MSSTEFVDVVGALFVEGAARFAFVAGLALGGKVLAVDGLRKDTGARGLAYSAGAAEQVGVRQLIAQDGILQGGGKRLLPHYALEGGGAVLTG